MITVTVIIGSKLFKKTIKHMVKFSKAFETWLIALSFAKIQNFLTEFALSFHPTLSLKFLQYLLTDNSNRSYSTSMNTDDFKVQTVILECKL